MREQITLTFDAQTSIRELSFDESEMVGGGWGPHINWGAVGHKASQLWHQAKANAHTYNWDDVGKSAGVGGLIGTVGGPYGVTIGALVGADLSLAYQARLI
jgi:hypothetical protein